MRFTASQYDQAIEALRAARRQIKPDGFTCSVCTDTSHQAWECGHNPLVAMAICEGLSKKALSLHDRLHALEMAMASIEHKDLSDWREEVHEFLHFLSGYDLEIGAQIGPARVSLPDLESPL